MYPLCNSWCLLWPYRRALLLKEIDQVDNWSLCLIALTHVLLSQTDPDVLCLQEVQADHFEIDIKPFLEERGYCGYYDQKTRESMGQAGKVVIAVCTSNIT